MPCFSPVDAWQLDTGEIRFVERGAIRRALKLACGQCVGCRIDRSRTWAVRILHESQLHAHSWFVTLTYDDKHLPPRSSLCYRDFQLFMYRLRKRYGRVRFYVAGEYGDSTGRPHYHACLFGLRFDDLVHYRKSPSGHTLWKSAELDALWERGLCSVGALTFESAAYTARYVCKKVLGDRAESHYRRVDLETGEVYYLTPEFARMSLKPGIGRLWFDKFRSDCLPRDYCIVDGQKVKVPKYYSQLLKLQAPFVYDEVEFARIQAGDQYAGERSPERLAVREVVAAARLGLKKRGL